MSDVTNAPLSDAAQIKEKILRIEAALLQDNPQLPLLLREIHTAIRNDHETVTILSEEEISILVRGLMKQTAVVISAEALAKGTKKAMKNMTVDDL